MPTNQERSLTGKERLQRLTAGVLIALGATGLAACGDNAEATPSPTTETTQVEPETNEPATETPTESETTPTETSTEQPNNTMPSPQEMAAMSHEELVETFQIEMTLEEFQNIENVTDIYLSRSNWAWDRLGDPGVLNETLQSFNYNIEGAADKMALGQIEVMNEAYIAEDSTFITDEMRNELQLIYKAQLDCQFFGEGLTGWELYDQNATLDPSSLEYASTTTNEEGDVIAYHNVSWVADITSNARDTYISQLPELYTAEAIDKLAEGRTLESRVDTIAIDEETGVVTVTISSR